jgi:hypothetical protein
MNANTNKGVFMARLTAVLVGCSDSPHFLRCLGHLGGHGHVEVGHEADPAQISGESDKLSGDAVVGKFARLWLAQAAAGDGHAGHAL